MSPHTFYIYTSFDFMIKSAGATRMHYYANALADQNHKVYMLSCCSTKLSDENFIEIEPNVFVLKKKELTMGFFSSLSFLRRLAAFSNQKHGGKSFLYYPNPLIFLEVFSLLYLKFYKREALFCEFNEVRKHSSAFHAPYSLKRPNYSIKKLIFTTSFSIIPLLLKYYDGLICISTNIERYARRYNKKTLRIPILTNPSIDIKKSTKNYFMKGAFNIGFSGTIHPTKENLDDFIQNIVKLKKEGFNVSFNLCGPVFKSYKDHFFQECESRSELNYFGNLGEDEFSAFLSHQDLLVIPRGYSLQNNYGFSTKLSDYLNHKKVVLITDISDNKLYIKDGENGFVVPTDDNDSMLDKLRYIIQNFDILKDTIITNAYETSKSNFQYKNYSETLRDFLKLV